ncbi:calmodulin-binding protein 60 A-like isoform X2 [Salvia divinorum]|uniref:Calmodulin-binding protein 60 A-like isoform X2 n=1 Tax=Salvia divinorum TaxID=28513 RepID=A0ABD1IEI0_SALDI
MGSDENGGSSEQLGQALDLRLTVRRIMEKEMKPMVLSMLGRVVKPMVATTVQQEIVPVAEDLFRRVIKDALQEFVEERFSNGVTRDDLPEERSLHLKFLYDKVSDIVTGEEFRGINDECLKLALLESDGNIVTCGNGSDARVEILLLDDNGNDGEDNMSLENFKGSIIETGTKKKPHFAKSVYKSLKEGVADLNGLKLGHDSARIKKYRCRLGARIVQNLDRATVLEAWTAPFTVVDKHDKYNKKHPWPSLLSEVWRLEGIGKTGMPCERLKNESIKTVKDFLFWFHVNPEELQNKILRVGVSAWNKIVSHAQKCNIDCKTLYSDKSSTEPQTCVIYDVVGKLKGGIIESYFVPIYDMSSDEKDRARELLRSVLVEPSAFVERYVFSLGDEDALLKKFPYRSLQHSALTVSEDMSGNHTTERGSSSQRIIAANNAYAFGGLSDRTSRPFPTDLHTSDYETLLCFENNPPPISMLVSGNDKHTAGMAGGSISGCSNASFQSAMDEEVYYPFPTSPDPMLTDFSSHNAHEWQWFEEEPPRCPGSPSPDLMLPYAVHVDIGSACAYGDETRGADPPKGWKKVSRLWSTVCKFMSGDAGSSCKRRRV